MIDFGEFQPFEDAEMIRPTITILRKQPPGPPMRLFKWLEAGQPPENLSEVIASAATMRTDHLGADAWELDSDEVLALRRKLAEAGKPLGICAGAKVFRGVITGLTEAFVISAEQRLALIAEDARSEEVIRPFAQGTHLRPWYMEDSGEFLIQLQSSENVCWPWSDSGDEAERVFRETTRPFMGTSTASENRPSGGKIKEDIGGNFAVARIGPHLSNRRSFGPTSANCRDSAWTRRGCTLGNTAYTIPGGDYYLLGVLASWTLWFYISKTAQPLRLRAGRWQYRLFSQFMEELPIPNAGNADRQAIAALAERSCDLGSSAYELPIRGATAYRRRRSARTGR